jgi:hypothetical protein
MYYYLIGSLKRRVILELKDSLSKHPVYAKAAEFVQNKFAFDERPNFGVVVKGASGNKIQLSPSNFIGIVQSHVMLACLDVPSTLIEWVREDLNVVKQGESFPTPAGAYYIECLEVPENQGEVGQYIIDPLYTVTDLPLFTSVSGLESSSQLPHNALPETVRVWENGRHPLIPGVDYTTDSEGLITFLTRFIPGTVVTVDYRYPGPSIGPVDWQWNTSDFKTLPGVVIAFGKRGKKGDKQVIMVSEDPNDAAQAYGGIFEATFDLDVIAQDPLQMEEMADYIVMDLWGGKRSALSFEGLELLDLSMGGEAEESYDELAEMNYYTTSLSLQIQAPWEIHVPIPFTTSRATIYTKAAESTFDKDRGTTAQSSVQPLSQGGLFLVSSPILAGRNPSFERIT